MNRDYQVSIRMCVCIQLNYKNNGTKKRRRKNTAQKKDIWDDFTASMN